MDQHFVPLSFSQTGTTLTVQAPSSGSYAPPGHYMLFIVNSNGVPSVAPIISVTAARTAPAAPTAVAAGALDSGAQVRWTAPDDGGSTITSYTVTPYANGLAQPTTTVNGDPAPTTATVSGLTNGTSYTFTVTATNEIGTSPAAAPSSPITPSATPAPVLVLATSGHTGTATSLGMSLPSNTLAGDRLVVETGIWSAGNATAKSVTDSAGDKFTELVHFVAGDGTEESVWSAPITSGSSGPPLVSVTPSAAADIGASVLEYSGLSTVSDATVVDRSAHAVGKTGAARRTVASGATPATSAGNELALGFYADSGFGDSLTAGSGWTSGSRSPTFGDMEVLAQDQVAWAGATPNATVATGANTYWLMSTLVLKGVGDVTNSRRSCEVCARAGAEPERRRLPASTSAVRRPYDPTTIAS